ncbi:hypothetical protein L3V79_07310 [Thiotrichales bacterium 19S9-12]|nr:hypothetical protein [Thiotrichales bacterium 19S9-11]MCF6812159.1 hypothetical protein [Thiotrichales bacterium 19S9-12]
MPKIKRSISFDGYSEEHIVGNNFSVHIEKTSPTVMTLYTNSENEFSIRAKKTIKREDSEHGNLHQHTKKSKDSKHYHIDFGVSLSHENLAYHAKCLARSLDSANKELLLYREDETEASKEAIKKEKYLITICQKASEKVNNRWFFGIAGRRVYLNSLYQGVSSYVVPDHFAETIELAKKKVKDKSCTLADLKDFINKDLKRHKEADVKFTTSRDEAISRLYQGEKQEVNNFLFFGFDEGQGLEHIAVNTLDS